MDPIFVIAGDHRPVIKDVNGIQEGIVADALIVQSIGVVSHDDVGFARFDPVYQPVGLHGVGRSGRERDEQLQHKRQYTAQRDPFSDVFHSFTSLSFSDNLIGTGLASGRKRRPKIGAGRPLRHVTHS